MADFVETTLNYSVAQGDKPAYYLYPPPENARRGPQVTRHAVALGSMMESLGRIVPRDS